MAKTTKKNYDHFVKADFKPGDHVTLAAEVNGMAIGTKAEVMKAKADNGAFDVKILIGPKHGQTHYILARDLRLLITAAKLKRKAEELMA